MICLELPCQPICITHRDAFLEFDNVLDLDTDNNIESNTSPVPELSFLPAPYRGSTRAGERRVQDNLHAHAQNAAIFSPQIGGKTIFGSTFQIWLVA